MFCDTWKLRASCCILCTLRNNKPQGKLFVLFLIFQCTPGQDWIFTGTSVPTFCKQFEANLKAICFRLFLPVEYVSGSFRAICHAQQVPCLLQGCPQPKRHPPRRPETGSTHPIISSVQQLPLWSGQQWPSDYLGLLWDLGQPHWWAHLGSVEYSIW